MSKVNSRLSVCTTGDVARLLQVAPKTILKWCDTGKLACYRVPGSRDRRITHEEVRRFVRAHGLPSTVLDRLPPERPRVLALTADADLLLALQSACGDRLELVHARTLFALGMEVSRRMPDALLLDAYAGRVGCLEAVACSGPCRVLVLCPEDGDALWVPPSALTYRRPCDLSEVASALTAVL